MLWTSLKGFYSGLYSKLSFIILLLLRLSVSFECPLHCNPADYFLEIIASNAGEVKQNKKKKKKISSPS